VVNSYRRVGHGGFFYGSGRGLQFLANSRLVDYKKDMIRKMVALLNLKDASLPGNDLAYWLSKTPEERISTVEFLRKQRHGDTARLQRIARVIQRATS
jgi:hypothetical protein